MKLDKMQFARLIAYVGNIVSRQNIDNTDLDMLDQIIDIDVPVSDPSRISPEALEHFIGLMAEGIQKIEAIKAYRTLTGAGLKEAKEAVERYWRSNGHYDPTKLSREDLLRKLTNECYASESTVATINNFIESCFR